MWRVEVEDAVTGEMSQSAALTELVTFQPGLCWAAQFQGTDWTLAALRGRTAAETITFRFVRKET